MAKPKKKRTKKYRPREIGFPAIVYFNGRKLISEKIADDLELSLRMQLKAFREKPTMFSWSFIVGILLICDRLSYDVEEGEELRKEFTTAYRRMDDAWKVWVLHKEIAHSNIEYVESLAPLIYEFVQQFSGHEIVQAREYVSNHNAKPIGYEA